METINFYQIFIFLLEGLFVAALLLVLFRIRSLLGIGMLFAALGLFQFMQVFLSSTVYVAITKDIIVSPGSSVLFVATLFAVLLIYIKEDASETRKIIYALVATNIVMSILFRSFSLNIEESSLYNPFNVSTKLFGNSAWVLIVGTAALFIDSLLIIIIYEFISKRITTLFFRICLTMLLVVNFDTIFFSLGAFWSFDTLRTILISGLISKSAAVIFYSIIFTIYLIFIEKDISRRIDFNFKDIFHTLTYRQKFEIEKKEKELLLKSSEQSIHLGEIKYYTLTNISPVGIFLTRVDGYTTYVNPKWCKISGLSQEEGIGNGWYNAVHPDDREIIKKGWDTAVSQNVESYAEYRFIHPDGSIRWVLGQAVPERNTEDQIMGYVGTITDITNIKLYEIELNRLKEKAEESDRLKSSFLANMSHEVRTPMNGILGFSELLKDPQLTGEKRDEYINIIEVSGNRMLNIINDIIDISKIEAGLMNLSLSSTNINKLVKSIFIFFKTETNQKGIQFTITSNLSDKEAFILTDKIKVSSILTNLIKNAIKFTDAGSIELNYYRKGKFLEFSVIDTGVGIPKDRLQAVFDRFIQADIADTRAFQGAGLGLSIAKAYVEMLDGKIWLESDEGKGSKFYFTLPYYQIDNENISLHKTDLEPEIVDFSKKIKILIADDDKFSDLLITSFIQGLCRDILHAKNGFEAYEICKNNSDIDLVLMDIKMPLMNGDAAAILIKELRPNIKIVAQSAYALTNEISFYSEIFDDYITKPIVKDKLITIVKKYIDLL